VFTVKQFRKHSYLWALERQTDTHKCTLIIRFLYYSYIYHNIKASEPKNSLKTCKNPVSITKANRVIFLT